MKRIVCVNGALQTALLDLLPASENLAPLRIIKRSGSLFLQKVTWNSGPQAPAWGNQSPGILRGCWPGTGNTWDYQNLPNIQIYSN